LHQQNPLPVLNWRCRLTQVDLYNGRKMVVVVVVGNVLSTDVFQCSFFQFTNNTAVCVGSVAKWLA